MKTEQVLLIFCVLRQIERSIDHRLPVSSTDWTDVSAFFQGEHHEHLVRATDEARKLLGGEQPTNNPTAISQSVRQRYSHRSDFVTTLKRGIEQICLRGSFTADEKDLVLSVFQRFQELLDGVGLQNRDAVSLRDDAALCETVIETRFPGLQGLDEARNIEAVGNSQRHRVYTIDEVLSNLNGSYREHASHKTA